MTESTVVFLPSAEGVEDPLTEVLRAGARQLVRHARGSGGGGATGGLRRSSDRDGPSATGASRAWPGAGDPDGDRAGSGAAAESTGPGRRGGGSDPVFPRRSCRVSRAGRARWTRRCRPLYLLGVSSGDFGEALSELVGPGASGLSPGVIGRLKSAWEAEHERWRLRDLSNRRYVYFWADGIYLQGRLEDEKQCVLVLIGATPEGRKELLGFQAGFRESAQSWRELLEDLKGRGLTIRPGTGDRGRGSRLLEGAGRELPPDAPPALLGAQDRQRAERVAEGPAAERDAGPAPDLDGARPRRGGEGVDTFAAKYQAKYPKAVTCLTKDREALLAFYDFPRSTGSTSGPRTPSRASSPRSGIAPFAARAASPTRRRWRWSSAGDCGQQDLAPPQRLRAVAPGHPGRQIHRRHSGRRNRNPRRRLIMPSPTFDHSSK